MRRRLRGRHVVLDPFAGTGSTLVAAASAGKEAIGLELSAAFVGAARKRFADDALFSSIATDGAANSHVRSDGG